MKICIVTPYDLTHEGGTDRVLLSSGDPRFGGDGSAARLEGTTARMRGPSALVLERDELDELRDGLATALSAV